jgi:ATP-dependent 26S proteasome regulatory subunit
VIEYSVPDPDLTLRLLRNRLATFDTKAVDWQSVIDHAHELSQADVTRSAEEAAKTAVLRGNMVIETADLVASLKQRRQSSV